MSFSQYTVLTAGEVLTNLKTSMHGLLELEAISRQKEFGLNASSKKIMRFSIMKKSFLLCFANLVRFWSL